MDLRSRSRKLSFELLTDMDSFPIDAGDHYHLSNFPHSNSDLIPAAGDDGKSNRRKRKKRKQKKRYSPVESPTMSAIAENATSFPESIDICSVSEEAQLGVSYHNYISQSLSGGGGSVVVCEEVNLPEESMAAVNQISTGELRQRTVSTGSGGVNSSEEEPSSAPVAISVSISWAGDSGKEEASTGTMLRSDQPNGKLQTQESLDWRQLMDPLLVETSPLRYFMEEMYHGNSLKSTTTLGNEKERERVYDTIFRLPWRCEWLINVGFFVCLNSFLSLFTIMPVRILTTAWRLLNSRLPYHACDRELKKISAAELSDFGCLVVLAFGVMILGRIDISLIYHMIRGQGIVKLYVVYNVLEIFDKLWQSFTGDVIEALFSSADGLAGCPPESSRYWLRRYTIDLIAITLSTCIVAHNNALLALLVSNNFAEIKSSVFKRFSKDNVHSIVYADSVERFHISAFLMFVLVQNILEAEGSWFRNFLSNALLVYMCEMVIDIIKHSFIAKFNDIKPLTYSEFLEDLCRQTLNLLTEGGKKRLTFVPLAPASVVTRVLTMLYAARLPCTLPWRLFWIVVLTLLTFVMLLSLKVMIGMALQKHAAWYIKRCQRRKLHSD
ncbi:hypothetical protein V2J09_001692 [Rumex salicifolius]